MIAQPILYFCAVAYSLTWACWLLIGLARSGWVQLPISEELLATVGQFGPFASAVLCSAVSGGSRALRDLWARLVNWRVRLLWFAVALLLPPVCLRCAILAHGLIYGQPVQSSVASDVATVLPHFIIIFVVGGPLGEELGWRGYALPRLRARWHPIPASAVLGVVWACWHLPLWWITNVPTSFAIYVIGILPLTYLFTWLSEHTKESVLIATLCHASLNTSLVRLPIRPAWGEWTVILWVVALIVGLFEWSRASRATEATPLPVEAVA